MFYAYETERLILKILSKEAAPLVLSFYHENRFQFEPWEPKRSENFYTLSYQKASLSAEFYQMTEGKLFRYWVFLKEKPEDIVGTVCFQNFLKSPYQSCSIGYKFDHRYVHQGYALESIRKGIAIMTEELKIHRIEAFIMPNNEPSLRLIERIPFVYEGTSYSYAEINGVWTDHKRYAFINPRDIRG